MPRTPEPARIAAAVAENPGSSTKSLRKLLRMSGRQWCRQVPHAGVVFITAPNHTKLWYLPGDEPEDA
jgi:hypothetical protein